MLQRFRQNRDLTGFDKTKPLPVQDNDSDSEYDSDREENENVNKQNFAKPIETAQKLKINEIENQVKLVEDKWWLLGDAEAVKRNLLAQKKQATQKIEKERYNKALAGLVGQKGQNMTKQIEMALGKSVTDDDGKLKFANNCQFYGNEKGYELALRDILHCVSLFK